MVRYPVRFELFCVGSLNELLQSWLVRGGFTSRYLVFVFLLEDACATNVLCSVRVRLWCLLYTVLWLRSVKRTSTEAIQHRRSNSNTSGRWYRSVVYPDVTSGVENQTQA